MHKRFTEIEYTGSDVFVVFEFRYDDGTYFSLTEEFNDSAFVGKGHDDIAFKAHQRLIDRLRAGTSALSQNLEDWDR